MTTPIDEQKLIEEMANGIAEFAVIVPPLDKGAYTQQLAEAALQAFRREIRKQIEEREADPFEDRFEHRLMAEGFNDCLDLITGEQS